MRLAPALTALLLTAFACVQAAVAQELDQIPDAVLDDVKEAPPVRGTDHALSAKAFIELAPQSTLWRDVKAVPIPSGYVDRSRWSGWSSADLRVDWRPVDTVHVIASDRLDQTYRDDNAPSTHQLRNSWREGYVDVNPADGWFVDAGRINDKEGVSTGFNPTDFFKRQAVLVTQNSDPAALRDARLGTVMARVQTVWDGGSVTVLAAPALVNETGALQDTVFNTGLDRTNRTNRFLLKGSTRVADDFSPEFLIFDEQGNSPVFGSNLTFGLGSRMVIWSEWAGGRRPDLIGQALREGMRTGAFPTAMTAPIDHDPTQNFRSQAVVGASLSFDSKLTVTVEGHYNQLGLSPDQWRAWFATGKAVPRLDAPLWQMRLYAQDAVETMSIHQIFLRADWPDFPVKDMELSGFAMVNPTDGGSYAQIEQDYYLNPVTILGLRAAASLGGQTSEWGSVPSSFSLLGRVVRYF